MRCWKCVKKRKIVFVDKEGRAFCRECKPKDKLKEIVKTNYDYYQRRVGADIIKYKILKKIKKEKRTLLRKEDGIVRDKLDCYFGSIITDIERM